MISLARRPTLRAVLFLLPGIGFLALLFGFPLISAFLGSFGLADGPGEFTTRYYAKVANSAVLRRGFSVTVYYAVAPVVISTILATGLALVIRRPFAGRALFSGLYKLPMAVPGIIVALMVLTLIERGGFFDRLLAPFDLTLPRLVRDPLGVGVIVASVWKQLPFLTLVITGAFAGVPEDVRNAARSLGANRIRAFFLVELPLALPAITAAVLITFVGSLGGFAIPDLIGAPSPLPLSIRMVRAFNEGNASEAYALGMVIAGFGSAVLLSYYALTAGIAHPRRQHDA